MALVAALPALGLGSAAAETVNCTVIDALPYTIDQSGAYCLGADQAVNLGAGIALTIEADDVVLDLNGHEIVNFNNGMSNTAYGVYSSNRRNVTIRNGTVRWFFYGVVLSNDAVGANSGHIVEGLRVDQCRQAGIYAVGRGNLIRHNLVLATGGTTSQGANASAYAIWVNGLDPRVVDNDVVWAYGQGTGRGSAIFLANDVRDAMVVENRVSRSDYGVRFWGFATGKYRDTLTSGVTTPFTGGTDAGGNH
jgi:hypothetical protein